LSHKLQDRKEDIKVNRLFVTRVIRQTDPLDYLANRPHRDSMSAYHLKILFSPVRGLGEYREMALLRAGC
jgi:hypothetical protein